MCLIVFSYQNHPHYPFILAANRDEFFDRPAIPLSVWRTDPEIVAGKDEKAGGTWLGLSKTGRFAALTNYRKISEIKEDAPSRGHLVTDLLLAEDPARRKLNEFKTRAEKYNGFNLIGGQISDLYYLSNKSGSIQEIEPGVHSVSNALLNTSWPKTERAKMKFQELLSDHEPNTEKMFQLLMDDRRFPIEKLPETGLSADLEIAVSSIFIRTPNYGTRCSTIVMVDNEGIAKIIEKTYSPDSKKIQNHSEFELNLNQQSS